MFFFSKEKDRHVINNFEQRDVFGKHVSENRSGCQNNVVFAVRIYLF